MNQATQKSSLLGKSSKGPASWGPLGGSAKKRPTGGGLLARSASSLRIDSGPIAKARESLSAEPPPVPPEAIDDEAIEDADEERAGHTLMGAPAPMFAAAFLRADEVPAEEAPDEVLDDEDDEDDCDDTVLDFEALTVDEVAPTPKKVTTDPQSPKALSRVICIGAPSEEPEAALPEPVGPEPSPAVTPVALAETLSPEEAAEVGDAFGAVAAGDPMLDANWPFEAAVPETYADEVDFESKRPLWAAFGLAGFVLLGALSWGFSAQAESAPDVAPVPVASSE